MTAEDYMTLLGVLLVVSFFIGTFWFWLVLFVEIVSRTV
jgi:hypothetical protein